MPGSGKGVVDEIARDLGFHIIVMGDIVREETAQRGLELTPENVGKVMLQIRKEEGASVVAKRCIAKFGDTDAHHILIEGIRSLDEVQEFRHCSSDFLLLAIHSSPQTRFHRLFNRRRSDDSSSRQVFVERDLRELRVGIGSAIAMADFTIVNEGNLQQFKAEIKSFLETILNE